MNDLKKYVYTDWNQEGMLLTKLSLKMDSTSIYTLTFCRIIFCLFKTTNARAMVNKEFSCTQKV